MSTGIYDIVAMSQILKKAYSDDPKVQAEFKAECDADRAKEQARRGALTPLQRALEDEHEAEISLQCAQNELDYRLKELEAELQNVRDRQDSLDKAIAARQLVETA